MVTEAPNNFNNQQCKYASKKINNLNIPLGTTQDRLSEVFYEAHII